jgi:hypothetical protein
MSSESDIELELSRMKQELSAGEAPRELGQGEPAAPGSAQSAQPAQPTQATQATQPERSGDGA